MLKMFSVASGSKGNCTFVTDGKTRVLVDVGISCVSLKKKLASIGEKIENIDAIFLTHGHSDHIKGVNGFANLNTPVYAVPALFDRFDKELNDIRNRKNVLDCDVDLKVIAFPVFHDVECVGYSFSKKDEKVSIVTDTGCFTEEIYRNVMNSKTVLIESNYDDVMLKNGRYPEFLKRRILSNNGHLSNDESSKVSARLCLGGTKNIILGHLSEENNTINAARKRTVEELERNGVIEGYDSRVFVSGRCGMNELVD